VSGQLEAPLNIIELGPERQLPKKKKVETQKETLPFSKEDEYERKFAWLGICQEDNHLLASWNAVISLKEKMHGNPRSHRAKRHPNFLF
jgi:hypothetical protein